MLDRANAYVTAQRGHLQQTATGTLHGLFPSREPIGADAQIQERIICLNGEINDYMSASIVAQLLWLESDTPDKPITMYINSPGGSVTSGTTPTRVQDHDALLTHAPRI